VILQHTKSSLLPKYDSLCCPKSSKLKTTTYSIRFKMSVAYSKWMSLTLLNIELLFYFQLYRLTNRVYTNSKALHQHASTEPHNHKITFCLAFNSLISCTEPLSFLSSLLALAYSAGVASGCLQSTTQIKHKIINSN
jgi:hypothetical protein